MKTKKKDRFDQLLQAMVTQPVPSEKPATKGKSIPKSDGGADKAPGEPVADKRSSADALEASSGDNVVAGIRPGPSDLPFDAGSVEAIARIVAEAIEKSDRGTPDYMIQAPDPASGGCCKGLAPVSECRCEQERKAAGHPPYIRSPDPASNGMRQALEWYADGINCRRGVFGKQVRNGNRNAWEPDNGDTARTALALPSAKRGGEA